MLDARTDLSVIEWHYRTDQCTVGHTMDLRTARKPTAESLLYSIQLILTGHNMQTMKTMLFRSDAQTQQTLINKSGREQFSL